jgi:NAD(P)-dependent dehydrogenase (short-subunit alcohol dehydrogenase family)
VKGPFFLVQALLPVFASPVAIVLNTSVNVHIGQPNTTVYGASKAALLSMARTLSGELISRAIRLNTVSPGPITTPLYDKLGLSAADLKAVSASIQAQVPPDASVIPAKSPRLWCFSPPMSVISRSAASCSSMAE